MKLHANYDDSCLVLQEAEYIEDGWYITKRDGEFWIVYMIPPDGGAPERIDSYPTFGGII